MIRPPPTTFEDLIAWQKTHRFVLDVYQLTESFSKRGDVWINSSLRRAAVSIASNIAEGFKRKGKADKVRFLNSCEGSIEECRYYLILAHDLGYGDGVPLKSNLEEVSKLVYSYAKSIFESSEKS